MLRKGHRLSVLLGLVLAALLVVGASCKDKTAPEVGALAPDFSLQTLSGETFRLSDFQGQPVLLNFWATWCPPCVVELPFIQAVFEEKKEEGLVVLAINIPYYGEDESTIQGFVEDREFTFPVGLDYNGSVATDYRIEYIPDTFFIDSEGVIKSIKVGAFGSVDEILDRLDSIMQ